MAFISDLDRRPFDEVSKGVHEFNEEELARLHKASEEVKEVVKSANDRQQKRMSAGA
jgi:hypothetical protein